MTLEEHARRLARNVGMPLEAAKTALQAIAQLRPLTTALVDELIDLGDSAADGVNDPDLGRFVTFLEMAANLAVRKSKRSTEELDSLELAA